MFIYGKDIPLYDVPSDEPSVDSDELANTDNSDATNPFSFVYGMDIPLEDVE